MVKNIKIPVVFIQKMYLKFFKGVTVVVVLICIILAKKGMEKILCTNVNQELFIFGSSAPSIRLPFFPLMLLLDAALPLESISNPVFHLFDGNLLLP